MRETVEIMQGIWTNEVVEHHGEFADFDPCGFGAKPVQDPHPPIFMSGLEDPKRPADRELDGSHSVDDREIRKM